ncbi:MAG: hypothetical protein HY720_31730 [Planctomycetes bacterium]|nr:hypothetical protein [Planctomycetota bacterium]
MAKAKMKDPGFDPYWFGVALAQFAPYKPDDIPLALLVRPLAFEDLKHFVDDWLDAIRADLGL